MIYSPNRTELPSQTKAPYFITSVRQIHAQPAIHEVTLPTIPKPGTSETLGTSDRPKILPGG